MTNRPNSMRHLDDAIRRTCGGSPDEHMRMRTLMANTIVAQMLPDGVVKGGSAIKMRFGDAATRFTTDLDTATASDPTAYIERLSAALSEGWEGFTGRIVSREPASPKDVPSDYVMRPFDVKLSYNGKPWCTVPLEVGHNEIGDADEADWVRPTHVGRIFEQLGFHVPGEVPLMSLPHQVAQKLHALTGEGERLRDLVDLQLIVANADLDLHVIRCVCERLFTYRKRQAWPPTVKKHIAWDESYTELSRRLPVENDIDSAVSWVNGLIAAIAES